MRKLLTLGPDTAATRVAAGAAHDLRNLLFVVSAHSHRLQAMAEPGHPWLDELRAMQEAADRCSELAAQIVSEAKMLDQPARPLDVNAVVRGVEPLIAQLIGDGITLTTALGPHVWAITANTVQIEQIVMNLAVNARDAMPQGGRLHISTENRTITGAVLGQPSHFVVLSVSDTGTGIDPGVEERIFEPYFTTKTDAGGTGVGLATVRNIALLHAGHVEVSTEPDAGTTIRVVLPRAPRPAAPPLRVLPRDVVRTGRMRVLLVESDPSIREFLQECLVHDAHQVVAASNGAEAIGAAHTTADGLDLLITDLFLPDLTGLDLATRLRAQWPDLPVVFLSDGHDAIDEVGEVPILVRPFTSAALAAAILRVNTPNRAA
jgi:CheY-like chemotaxis protein